MVPESSAASETMLDENCFVCGPGIGEIVVQVVRDLAVAMLDVRHLGLGRGWLRCFSVCDLVMVSKDEGT